MRLGHLGYSRGAHRALGYESWGAYVSEKFSDAGHGLPAPVRRELVSELSEAGLSTRAIAPVVGVSQKTADRDTRRQVSQGDSPATESEVSAPPCGTVGIDGKTYPKPPATTSQPERKPRRNPLPEQFGNATDDLDRVLRRLVKLAGDDRVDANRDTLARVAKRIRRSAEELLKVADLLDPATDKPKAPPKYGGNRRKPAQIIAASITSAQGLCLVLDEIETLGGQITEEEAGRYTSDLSTIIRSLKRIQSLLTRGGVAAG